MAGGPGEGWQILEEIAPKATDARCAEMLGGCDKSIAMTATYKKANAAESIPGDTDYHHDRISVALSL